MAANVPYSVLLDALFNLVKYQLNNQNLHPYDALRGYLAMQGINDQTFHDVSYLFCYPSVGKGLISDIAHEP